MSVREVLQENWKDLVTNLGDTDYLVEDLYSNRCFTERQYQIIKAEKIQIDKTAKLLEIIANGGLQSFTHFRHALAEEYPWLSDKLKDCSIRHGLPRAVDVPQQKFSLPATLEEKIPTEHQLLKISKIILKTDWEVVVLTLGITMRDLDQSKLNNSIPLLQCMDLLVTWLRRNGDNATFSVLFKAMQDADIAESQLNEIAKSVI